jgi:hypothetical protein
MEIDSKNTIFSKMNTTYEEFRHQEFPIKFLKDYYRKNSSKGEYIWWIDQDKTSPLQIKFFNTLSQNEQLNHKLNGLIMFPEMFSNMPTKFNLFMLYLLNEHSIVCPNIRDLFTAGGQVTYNGKSKIFSEIPRIFNLIINNKLTFINCYNNYLITPDFNDTKNTLQAWIDKVSVYSEKTYPSSKDLLEDLLL